MSDASAGDGVRTEETGAGADPAYLVREAEARMARRIEGLERHRRRTRWGLLALSSALVATLVAVGFALAGPEPSPEGAWSVGSLTAGEVVLRDADGVGRARLGTTDAGRVLLALRDRDGRDRIRLSVLEDGSPGIAISDRRGRSRAVLGFLADGTTNLVFADADGVTRAVLGLDPDGSTRALFTDRRGAPRAVMGVDAGGVATMEVIEAEEAADGGSRDAR